VAAEEEEEKPKQVEQEGDHRAEMVAESGPSDQPVPPPDGVLATDRRSAPAVIVAKPLVLLVLVVVIVLAILVFVTTWQ
jgi:hypothetical protein